MNHKNTFQNTAYILKYTVKLDKNILVLFSFYTVLSAINPFIGLFFPKIILDEITGHGNFAEIVWYIILFFLSSSLLGFLLPYLKGKYEPRIMRLRLLFTEMFHKKVMELDYRHLEDPDVLNDAQSSLRAINNNTTGIEGILNHLFQIAGILLSFLGYITIITTLNIYILLYLISGVLITYLLTIKVKKFEYSIGNEVSRYERKSNYLLGVMSDFSYGKEIRLFRISDWLKNKFESILISSIHLDKKVRKKYLLIHSLSIVLGLIRDGIAYAYLIYCVLVRKMSIGDFTLYFSTIRGFDEIMNRLLHSLAEIRTQNLYIDDYRKFLSLEDTVQDDPCKRIPRRRPYSLELQHVSFKYPKSDKIVLKNISLKITPGEKLAIVGTNGSGKTTLVKLLCRLYAPDEGSILLNGLDVQCFNKDEYYQLFSVLFQDYKLLAFTVFENLTLNKRQNSSASAKNALDSAGLWDKVNSLEKGIDTNLFKIFDENGVELSGGEKQKLALARALYKNGDIVILDEPTAALDPIAEAHIYENFNKMTNNKTSIYISHRLSSTKFCDKIIFLENGEIIEFGNHEQLMQQDGKYAKLFKIQSQYYEM